MRRISARSAWLASTTALVLLLAGCSCSPDPGPDDGGSDAGPRTILDTVPETARFEIPCLSAEAAVIRTEMDVPHIYASSRQDAFCIFGFVMAKDRFFQMDLTRRLSQGRLSELLGDAALGTDVEERMKGGAFITELQLAALTDEEAEEMDAFAAGINAYIQAVRDGALPLPSEIQLGAALLGARVPSSLLHEWDRRDVIATGTTVLYGTSFETGDVGRDRDHARADTLFEGFPDRDLRLAGLREEIMDHYAPPNDSSSAAGFGLETATSTSARATIRRRRGRRARATEQGTLDRLAAHLDRIVARMPRQPGEGYGSNVWAVAGGSTPDGRSLLAGDGHLQLSVPALFWQVGMDTAFLSGDAEGTRVLGATIAGLPAIGVGTNGHVAWSQTAYFADVTDWYREEIVLGADGLPAASRFEGADRPLVRHDETYVVANVPALGSVGRTDTIARFTTFDGRWLTSIEGTPVPDGETPPASAVNMMGEWIVPGDVDGDGVVSAVSFYYGPFDGGSLLRAFRLFGLARNVGEYREAMRHFIGYGGSMMASDADGDVLYSAYHAVPCRGYLPRDPVTNRWIDGADPRRLIDGTRYGSWSIPLTADGRVDEAAGAGDPRACAVPFEEWPMALSPARGYVQHANNDPGNVATDDDLFDDPHYIGGPWIEGYRASRIEDRLEAAIAADTATLDEMQAIQADHHSNLGEDWVPILLAEIEHARAAAASSPAPGTSEARIAAAFTAEQAAIEDVEARLSAWRDAGYPTPSGVETFYSTPASADAASAIATTIFGTWFPRFVRGTLDDEQIPGGLSPAVTGDTYRMQTIDLLVRGRGAGNPEALGSWEPTREESVFFDDVRTAAEVETSHEIAIRSLGEALAFLRSEPTGPGEGGFGSSDPSAWIWGLRHGVRFDSLLADFLGDDPMFSVFVDRFSINPELLPLAEGIGDGDPRQGLTFFPRPGDQFDIDAANPGMSGERFTHGSGPVFRMVIALGPDGVEGRNILPGGQSGLTTSDHFADQVRLWLANETIPMRFTVEEVVEGGEGREVFLPMAAAAP